MGSERSKSNIEAKQKPRIVFFGADNKFTPSVKGFNTHAIPSGMYHLLKNKTDLLTANMVVFCPDERLFLWPTAMEEQKFTYAHSLYWLKYDKSNGQGMPSLDDIMRVISEEHVKFACIKIYSLNYPDYDYINLFMNLGITPTDVCVYLLDHLLMGTKHSNPPHVSVCILPYTNRLIIENTSLCGIGRIGMLKV